MKNVQPDSGAHAAPYSMSKRGFFSGVKRLEREVDRPPPLVSALYAFIKWAGTHLPFMFTRNLVPSVRSPVFRENISCACIYFDRKIFVSKSWNSVILSSRSKFILTIEIGWGAGCVSRQKCFVVKIVISG